MICSSLTCNWGLPTGSHGTHRSVCVCIGDTVASLCMLVTCRPSDRNRMQGYVEGEFMYVASPFAGALESLHVQRGAQGKADDPLFWLDSTSEQAARDEAERRLAQDRADCSAPAEMSAALRSSRLSFDPPETTVFVHRSLAAQLLTSATSRRHLLGTVYALGRLGQRCEPITTLKM